MDRNAGSLYQRFATLYVYPLSQSFEALKPGFEICIYLPQVELDLPETDAMSVERKLTDRIV
ncbi:hypothetical protein [Rhizobium laguerreae]|uniref:hypothetical protein n=1 Tax=Rhizobium laguerreae TaxID=1076926 RepID=UPI0021B0F172|nr:hypothetical protein [Rhizobium laguerreae]